MSIWSRIMLTKSKTDLSDSDWSELKEIASSLHHFEFIDDNGKKETINKRAKRLLELLGFDSWQSIYKTRESAGDDINFILKVALKYRAARKKYIKKNMTFNMFCLLGKYTGKAHLKTADFFNNYSTEKKEKIDDNDFFISSTDGNISRGSGLRKDYYNALKRFGKKPKDIDTFFEFEYGMPLDEFQTLEQHAKIAKKRVREELQRLSQERRDKSVTQ